MGAIQSLESTLQDWFVKKAPALPDNAKDILVKYLPWINLVFGILALYLVYALWHWAHTANNLVDFANNLSAAYGGSTVDTTSMNFGIWLAIIVLAVEALLYIVAFPATRDRKKSGWNLMFYAMLVNIAYGVVVMFTAYGDFSNFIGSVIGSAIGLYLLFQIRSRYLQKESARRSPAKKS
jgi:cation transport ATPase